MASLSTCHQELVVWDGNLVKPLHALVSKKKLSYFDNITPMEGDRLGQEAVVLRQHHAYGRRPVGTRSCRTLTTSRLWKATGWDKKLSYFDNITPMEGDRLGQEAVVLRQHHAYGRRQIGTRSCRTLTTSRLWKATGWDKKLSYFDNITPMEGDRLGQEAVVL